MLNTPVVYMKFTNVMNNETLNLYNHDFITYRNIFFLI